MQAKQNRRLPQQIIYGGIISAALLFGPKWGGFWAFTQSITGGAVGLGALGQLKRHEEGSEVPSDLWAFVRGGVLALGEEYEEIRQIAIDRLPQPLAELIAVTEAVGLDSEAKFRELHKYSLLIIGQTNAGKTWTQHQSVVLTSEEMAKGGTGRVFDLTYGKRGHRWHELPRDRVVFTELYSDLPRLLDEAIAARDQRRREAKSGDRETWPKHILHIAELNNSLQEYSDWYEQLDETEQAGIAKPKTLVFKIKNLLTDGHGYGVLLRADVQTLAVGETSLNLAMLGQVNILVLGSSAVNVTELGKVLGKDAKAWAEKVAMARKSTGNDYIGISIIERKPSLIAVPDLAASYQISITPGAELSTTEAARQWAIPFADTIAAAKSATEAFGLLKDHMPEGYRKQASDNPYYQAIKELKS